jgi:zinc transport system substrate-binding protein
MVKLLSDSAMTAFSIFSAARVLCLAAALAHLLVPATSSIAAPNVVVTIKPVHSLAAAILEGVTEPKLLLDGAASPHSYALKPSDAQALSSADAIIRVSENLEVFLNKAIATLPEKARVIGLDNAPGLTLLPVRKDGGLMQNASRDNEGDHEHERRHGPMDVHFWLDPVNAIVISGYLAQQFAELDPEHAAQYRANAGKLEAKLAALDAELNATLKGLSNKPFIVFHDVTQYLEHRYGLRGLGAVTLSPERPPGARRLEEIRDKIRHAKAICVFSEPQFPPKLVETLTEGADAKGGVLDEIGAAIPPGPGQYIALMRADAESLASCLKN